MIWCFCSLIQRARQGFEQSSRLANYIVLYRNSLTFVMVGWINEDVSALPFFGDNFRTAFGGWLMMFVRTGSLQNPKYAFINCWQRHPV